MVKKVRREDLGAIYGKEEVCGGFVVTEGSDIGLIMEFSIGKGEDLAELTARKEAEKD